MRASRLARDSNLTSLEVGVPNWVTYRLAAVRSKSRRPLPLVGVAGKPRLRQVPRAGACLAWSSCRKASTPHNGDTCRRVDATAPQREGQRAMANDAKRRHLMRRIILLMLWSVGLWSCA